MMDFTCCWFWLANFQDIATLYNRFFSKKGLGISVFSKVGVLSRGYGIHQTISLTPRSVFVIGQCKSAVIIIMLYEVISFWFIENLFCTIVGLLECAGKEILELVCMVAKVASGKNTKYTSEVQLMMKLCPCVTMVAALTDSKQSQNLLFVCHDINQHNVLVAQAHTTMFFVYQ